MNGQPVPGRAIAEIDSQLPKAKDTQSHRLLRARKANLLTKVGRIAEARSLVDQLRVENRAYEPNLSAWIMLVEGLLQHFGSLDVPGARDKFRRSYAVAVAIGNEELRAISAAWLADSDYRLTNYNSACERIKEVFNRSHSESHEARSRASLVIASMANLAGNIEIGSKWFKQARFHAVADGDIGMQSVMLFNSVSTRASALMVDNCLGLDTQAKAENLLAELNSVRNLDMGLGIQTLGTMIPTLEGELLGLMTRWPESISKLESVVNQVDSDGQARRAPRYWAQLTWCYASAGANDLAMSAASHAIRDAEDCSDIDDTIILYSRLSSALSMLGSDSDAAIFKGYADRATHAYSEFRTTLGASIAKLLAEI